MSFCIHGKQKNLLSPGVISASLFYRRYFFGGPWSYYRRTPPAEMQFALGIRHEAVAL